MNPPPTFVHEPDPDNPGWMTWRLSDPTRFNSVLGPMIVRLEGDGQARVRMFPAHGHTNLSDNVHGGALLAFADVALFAASRLFGLVEAGTAVTLDFSMQFVAAGKAGEPLDAVVDLLRETGRLLFLRALVVQGNRTVAAFTATIRKPGGK